MLNSFVEGWRPVLDLLTTSEPYPSNVALPPPYESKGSDKNARHEYLEATGQEKWQHYGKLC